MSPHVPTLIAPDTDLLVGSLLYTPVAPPLGPGAGGWPPAPCEGRRGSPSRESTRVPHLVTPVSRLGFSGAGGLWPGASALAGRRRPEGTWLATQAPMPGGPRPIPCLLQRCSAQSWCAQAFGTLHPASDVLSQTEWIFYSHLVLTVSRLFSLCTLEDHLDPGSVCCGGEAHSPGPTMPSAFPFPGALGQQLGRSPPRVLGRAKASQLVTMQRLPREAPWAARWALTRPPKSLTCWP